MKCDELKAEPMIINDDYTALYYPKYQVDAAIDELKTENESLLQQNRELCLALQVMYSKEEYDKQKAENAELKQNLEDAKATAYAESVDAGMRERRLKRALWIARAELCHRLDVDRYLRKHRNSWYNENCLTWAESCEAMEVKMCKAESKCLAKAEEYK